MLAFGGVRLLSETVRLDDRARRTTVLGGLNRWDRHTSWRSDVSWWRSGTFRC